MLFLCRLPRQRASSTASKAGSASVAVAALLFTSFPFTRPITSKLPCTVFSHGPRRRQCAVETRSIRCASRNQGRSGHGARRGHGESPTTTPVTTRPRQISPETPRLLLNLMRRKQLQHRLSCQRPQPSPATLCCRSLQGRFCAALRSAKVFFPRRAPKPAQ